MSRRSKKNFEPQRVKIESLHVDGYGVTQDPKLVVVGALAGEEITVQPFSKKKRKLYAKPIEIHDASPHRVEPPCDAAGLCGGCSLQHFDVKEQIKFKQQFLVDCLSSTPPLQYYAPVTGPVENYRSKGRLGVKYVDKKDRILVGFREKMKPYIADIDDCTVLRTSVSELIPALVALISKLSVKRQIPQIEIAVGDEETALVFRHLEELTESDREHFLVFAEEHDISIYFQPSNPESVVKFYPQDGVERLTYYLPDFDLRFSFHPLDFTQVNQQINRKMVNLAVALLDLKESDNVFDGFCGIGNFSLALATKSAHVLGIEASETCVQRAKENAEQNGLKNCRFLTKDLFATDLDIPGLEVINKVLLDPPRSGAFEVCKKLASTKVERVVYVSCNPVTLARDAAVLIENGFRLEGAGVIDMFPHTTHVESIACFLK